MKQKEIAANGKPVVWNEEANSGLDTIRKIILGKFSVESEQKFKELQERYEKLFAEMEQRLLQKEHEHATRLQKLEDAFNKRVDELRDSILNEIKRTEVKIRENTEQKTEDFGKLLMDLGREWTMKQKKK